MGVITKIGNGIEIEHVSEEEIRLIEAKFKIMMMNDVRKNCKSHGYKVRKSGEKLWLVDSDRRYDFGKNVEVLYSLGFKWSTNLNNWYWRSV